VRTHRPYGASIGPAFPPADSGRRLFLIGRVATKEHIRSMSSARLAWSTEKPPYLGDFWRVIELFFVREAVAGRFHVKHLNQARNRSSEPLHQLQSGARSTRPTSKPSRLAVHKVIHSDIHRGTHRQPACTHTCLVPLLSSFRRSFHANITNAELKNLHLWRAWRVGTHPRNACQS
jgi:hypothetical protein